MNKSDLAEIFGIMLGDGNLYIKGDAYQIRISGHKNDDRPYLVDYVKPLFERTFGVKVYEKFHNTRNEMFICVNSRKVAEILMQNGFKSGRKKTNSASIPKWIKANKSYAKRCVRGLVDTDGFVYPIRLGYKYPRIGFVSGIPTLREDFSSIIGSLGFHVSKWTLRKSGWTSEKSVGQCTISRREDVMKFYKEIKFKNPKYVKDFNRFKLPSSSPAKRK